MNDDTFTKVENEHGEVTGFTYEGEVPEEVEDLRQPVALAFDSRHSYDNIGRPFSPVWMESETAMALEEAGIFRLVGADTDEIPQPVTVEGVARGVFLYTVERAS